MTNALSRTLNRSIVAPYVAVFVLVLAIFATGVHIAVDVLAERDGRARLDELARAAVAVTDSKAGSYELDEQADAVASPIDQRATWFDARGRIIAVRGAKGAGFGRHRLQERRLPILDDRGKPIGSVLVEESDERQREIRRGVDLGLGVGLVLATLTSVVGGRFLSRKALARITENVRSLEEFSANAAHELRTPLAAIIANAEASLRAGTLDEQDAHRARTVVSTAMSMRRVSDDLLTLAIPTRVSAGELFRIDLDELVTSVLALVAPLAERRGIATSAQIEGAPWVFGQPEQIERVVVNLVENAVRYTRTGGRVSVIARDERDGATIVVRDTGIGISPEDRGHVFERFWRADHARRVGDGSGLGLAIVAALVERHRGTIRVESELGVGSSFTVRLPRGA